MTNHSLIRATATALVLVAACKSDFPAGSYDDGGPQDVVAREVANSQEGGPPTSSTLVSCDPFRPTTKPIALTTVLGVGRDTDGTLYVVDQPQPGGERVFVSSGGALQRQRGAASATESSGNGVISYTFSISDHVPPFMLKLETNAAGPTAMGVLQGDTTNVKTFTIGQQGSVLTLVPPAQIAGLPVANIPAQTFIEYNATLSDGRALLVVRPLDDWTFQDFRVFFGAADRMIERPVGQVVRYKDGGSTTINFTIDGVAAVASFPVSLTGVAAPPTLTIGTTQLPLTLGPTASSPGGYGYSCFGNLSIDAAAGDGPSSADGASTGAQESGPPTSSSSVSCDPFQPTTKPISLTTVLGVGQDTDGTLYVVDQPQSGSEHVFVSSGGTLQRQRIAGTRMEGTIDGMICTFSITDHVPPFTLKLETNAAGPAAMSVARGGTDRVLTLVATSQVDAMPVANLPAETFVDCNATIPDGRVLLVVRPRDDWTTEDFRVFFGTRDHLLERLVTNVVQGVGGDGTVIHFTVDGVPAVADDPSTLTIGSTVFPLTTAQTNSPPSGYTYFCFGNPSIDAAAGDGPSSADGASTAPTNPTGGVAGTGGIVGAGGAVGTGGTPGSGGTVGTGGTTATGGAFGTLCTTNQDCPSDAICCDGGSPSCDGTRLPAGDRANPGELVVSADGMTVTDTITGLIWQRDGSGTRAGCSADGSLRCTLVEALAYCASLDLGGLVDWRLPAWKELLTIVDPTTDKNTSSIDQTAFPSTPAEGFWSSSPYLGSSSSDFYVDFSNSTVGYCAAPILRRVRCVHGSRCYPTSRFAVLDDEQVRDTLTGLVWQRHDGKTKAGLATCMNWADAQSCCSSLGSGYRLPTLKELDTLLLATGSSGVPILDQTVFPATMYPPYYWTSSPYGGPDASLSGYARFGGFPTSASCDTGGQNWYELRICWPVRCVR